MLTQSFFPVLAAHLTVEVATNAPENAAASSEQRQDRHRRSCTSLSPCTRARNTSCSVGSSGWLAWRGWMQQDGVYRRLTSSVSSSMPMSLAITPAQDARQDGLDGQLDGADEHRSRRAARHRMARQHIRLTIRGRSPAGVALRLLRHILTSIVAMSVASRRRPSQLRLHPSSSAP